MKKADRTWGLRKWRAAWRDTLLLLRDFCAPLALFSLAVIGGGILYNYLANLAGEPVGGLAEAIYSEPPPRLTPATDFVIVP
jgi:hypothetical protein